ncbi:SET domain protein [uncultured archaeon]|nr:SET domain protein [uncultured archaeon]
MMKKRIPKVNTKYIKVKKSKIHNNGVFASKNIKKGTKIIEYVGEIVSKEEGDKRSEEQFKRSRKNKSEGSVYVYDLTKKYDLDGNFKWNPARLINHSCEPNAKYKQVGLKIFIIAIRSIKKGEEISYDYGYDLDDYKDHKCKCGKEKCIGYIIGKNYRKDFEKLRKKRKY